MIIIFDYVVLFEIVIVEVCQGLVEGGILIGVVLYYNDGCLFGCGYN